MDKITDGNDDAYYGNQYIEKMQSLTETLGKVLPSLRYTVDGYFSSTKHLCNYRNSA
jgi:hypothetical protein